MLCAFGGLAGARVVTSCYTKQGHMVAPKLQTSFKGGAGCPKCSQPPRGKEQGMQHGRHKYPILWEETGSDVMT